MFYLNWGSRGALNANRIVASGSPLGPRDDAAGNFQVVRGQGKSGW